MPRVIARLPARTSTTSYVEWDAATHSGWVGGRSRMSLVTDSLSLTYVFPYSPIEIQSSSVSNEYVSIDRPGRYPLVELRGPQLTEISFSFLVASRASVANDGVNKLTSVENQLKFLHSFVSTDGPVFFSGLGNLLSTLEQFSTGQSIPRAWNVTDFSHQIIRLNESNQPMQAQASISLRENRNPNFTVRQLSKINYVETPPVVKAPPPGGTGGGGAGFNYTDSRPNPVLVV
jgi:hypothetical protein